jgi:hypothetical protein
MRHIVRRAFVVSIVAVLVGVSTASAQPAPSLFEDLSSAAAPATAPSDAGVRRSRTAIVRADRMEAALSASIRGGPSPFALNLFDDVVLAVEYERTDRDVLGHAVWVGLVAGDPFSSVTLTWRGGELHGLVHTGGVVYRVRTVAGRQIIEELLPVAAIELPPRRPAARRSAAATAPAANAASGGPAAPANGIVETTMLVYYTQAAENRSGGPSAIQAAIAQAVTNTNTALTRSLVSGQLRVVAAEKLTGYVESASIDFDLDALFASAEVLTRQNALQADQVMLIVGRTPQQGVGFVCGLANLGPGDPDSGLGAVEEACMNLQHSFAHEAAHNWGANHAPEDCLSGGVDVCGGLPYGRGYKDAAAPVPFRTLLAYDCPSVLCPRVLNYSNPSVNEITTNRTTGTTNQFNARAINEVLPLVAVYRGPAIPVPPGNLNVTVTGTSVTISWQAAPGATAYIIEVGLSPGSSSVLVRNVGLATTVTGTGVPAGTYYFRVRSQTSSGLSAPSAEVTFTIGGGTPPPGQPGALQVTVNSNTVTISWGAATGATSYLLEAGTGPGSSNIASGIPVASTSYQVGGVPAGLYYVRVRGVGPGGVGPPTADATISVGGCVPPSAPQNLTHTVNGANVSLSWTLSASGSPPITYALLVGLSSNTNTLGPRPVGPGPSITAQGPAGTYFVRVVASNACGTSSPSNERVVVIQ